MITERSGMREVEKPEKRGAERERERERGGRTNSLDKTLEEETRQNRILIKESET